MREAEILLSLKKERIELEKQMKRINLAIQAFEPTYSSSNGSNGVGRSKGKFVVCAHPGCGKEFLCGRVYASGNFCSYEHFPSRVKMREEAEAKFRASSSPTRKDKGTILVPSADRR